MKLICDRDNGLRASGFGTECSGEFDGKRFCSLPVFAADAVRVAFSRCLQAAERSVLRHLQDGRSEGFVPKYRCVSGDRKAYYLMHPNADLEVFLQR